MSGCCGSGISVVDGSSDAASGGAFAAAVQYELDFSAEANKSLTAGAQVIDSETWTVAISGTDTLDIVNGSGLQYVASATSGVFTGATATASHLYLPLSALYTRMANNVDARSVMACEIYASALNITGTGYLPMGLWGVSGTPTSSGTRFAAAERAIAGGVQVWRAHTQTGTGFNYQIGTTDVWGITSYAVGALSAYANVWGGAWPTTYTKHQNVPVNLFNSLRDENTRLVIAFATNGTSGTMTATIERIRITAWPVAA